MNGESGWLLDNGILCVGAVCGGLGFVTYSDERAIRFARKEDALNMKRALSASKLPFTVASLEPVEHGWG